MRMRLEKRLANQFRVAEGGGRWISGIDVVEHHTAQMICLSKFRESRSFDSLCLNVAKISTGYLQLLKHCRSYVSKRPKTKFFNHQFFAAPPKQVACS